jgi:S1-C subfamily serine protease
MRTHLPLGCVALLALPGLIRAAGPPPRLGTPAEAVVKVSASLRYPNPIKPWTLSKSVEVAGSGVVLTRNRILTNAHVVLYATEIHIQSRAGADKFEAKLEHIAPNVDLALLSVADKTFFEQRRPLARAAALPKNRDTVEVYGFPVGGAEQSVTRGVISRMDYGPYYEGHVGLILQVSAAVNEGNSGGPAVVGGKMVGVVVSRLEDSQNIGYVIPNEEIDLFLDDIKDGRYDGKPSDATWTQYQTLENHALRDLLKLDKRTRGILAVPPSFPVEANPFHEFDVITRIGDHDIDNKGMVRLANGMRMSFNGLIPRLARANAVPLTVIRKGKRLTVSLPVTTRDDRLVRRLRGEQPSYFIHGPLAFSSAKQEVLNTYLKLNPNTRSPLVTRQFDRARFPGEELVVVTAQMFEHKIAKGYSDPVGQVLVKVNGTKIKNLHHLVEMLRDSTDEFLQFRFEEGGEVLVFRRTQMDRATDEILEEAGIAPSRRASKDMLAVWNKKRTAARPGRPAKDR